MGLLTFMGMNVVPMEREKSTLERSISRMVKFRLDTYHAMNLFRYQYMQHLKVIKPCSRGRKVKLGGRRHQTLLGFDIRSLLFSCQHMPVRDVKMS